MWTPTDPDAFHTFLRTRRSIRRFQPDPVPEEAIRRVILTSTYAPSAHNLQPWRFAWIKSHESRLRLAHALTAALRADMQTEGAPPAEIEARVARSMRRILEAPVLLLLCRDRTAIREPKIQDEIMAIQSAAAAGLQLLLAAHAEGLGGNWICWPLYAPEATRQALDLPPDWQPQALFALGYPATQATEKSLLPWEQIVLER